MTPGPTDVGERALAPLREDIRLLPTRPGPNGAPQWALFDPIAHQYFLVGIEACQILAVWPDSRTIGEAAARATRRSGRETSSEEVAELHQFLTRHELLQVEGEGWRGLAALKGSHGGLFRRILHGYLFFKVPLFRPERFLRASLPAMRMLVSPLALALIALLGLTGLYMASRRWDQFLNTFNDFWSPEGAMVFATALLILKMLHELGHAYVATAKGCRVQSMGVIFMLGAPMPYTDVTDAWKLTNRRDRIAIDLAGVAVELVVAVVATFAWVFLPDGTPRAIAFALATTAWVMSLAINLNPFMRFDGYFVLADLVNLPNLQPRSFALAKWSLRRLLFGLDTAPPEQPGTMTRRLMTLYGVSVWIYRLVAFTGIALAVYHMFFKALGIILFVIEIAVLLALPIWRELKVWWQQRQRIAMTGRSMVTGGLCLLLIGLCLYPISSRVSVPAILEPASHTRLYPATGGRVVEVLVRTGDLVAGGDPLVRLDSESLRHEAAQAERRLELVRARLDRRAVDRKDLAATPQLEQEREALLARLEAIAREREQLVIRAPFPGRIAEFNPTLHVGRSIARTDEVALLIGHGPLITRGYARLDEIWRISPGSSGVFRPENLVEAPLNVRLTRTAPAGARAIEIPALASPYGGAVETWPASRTGELAPVHASHLVEFELVDPPAGQLRSETIGAMRRGTVLVEAAPESVAARAWRQALRVLVQESGA